MQQKTESTYQEKLRNLKITVGELRELYRKNKNPHTQRYLKESVDSAERALRAMKLPAAKRLFMGRAA